MKKLITIALLLSSFGVMAQSKKKESPTIQFTTASTMCLPPGRGFFGSYPTPVLVKPSSEAWISVNNRNSGLFLQMDRYPIGLDKEIESITIHVNRSRTVWVNDSTLVIKQK